MIPETSILIVHVNGEDILKECLSSVFKNSPKSTRVFVLFNSTSDGSREMVKKNFPRVHFFSSEELLGFAEASNFLARKTSSPYLVFLNNDAVVGERWLTSLLRTLENHPRCAACQPKVRSYHSRENFEYAGAGGGFIDKYGYPFCRGRIFNSIEKDREQYDDEIRIFWASGVCLFIRREDFEDAGGFDEDFFMYAEEVDLCWRLNLFGKEVWYSPKSVIYHVGSYSVKKANFHSKKDYLIIRNHLFLLLKNYSWWSLVKILPFRILLEILSAIRFFPSWTLASLKSFFSVPWIFFTKLRKKRKAIQKRRSVLDRELRSLMYLKSIALSHFIFHKKTFKELRIG